MTNLFKAGDRVRLVYEPGDVLGTCLMAEAVSGVVRVQLDDGRTYVYTNDCLVHWNTPRFKNGDRVRSRRNTRLTGTVLDDKCGGWRVRFRLDQPMQAGTTKEVVEMLEVDVEPVPVPTPTPVIDATVLLKSWQGRHDRCFGEELYDVNFDVVVKTPGQHRGGSLMLRVPHPRIFDQYGGVGKFFRLTLTPEPAAAPAQPLPCPFCGTKPSVTVDGAIVCGAGCVVVKRSVYAASLEAWNRRAK